jgi:hypothetical protein
MAIDSILAQIDAEIARLTQVRALLSGAGKATTAAATKTATVTSEPKRRGRKRRVLSAEARKRIADAQRKRWAAQKAKGGKAAKAK